jgi:SAM-dependent methyltransferase
MTHSVQSACRSCGEQSLTQIQSPAGLPPAAPFSNDNRPNAAEARRDLELVICPRCALVQIAPPAVAQLPARHRPPAPREAASRDWPALATQIVVSQKLRPTSLVVEIGSGDARLLETYQQAGVPVLAIERALDPTQAARDVPQVPILAKSFNRDLAARLEACGQSADVVHAHHVLEHAADPNDLAAGLKIVLKPTGVAVVEVSYVKDLVAAASGDPALDQQCCYFSLTSLAHLLARHGLVVHDVERVRVHGGSLRLFLGQAGDSSHRVRLLLEEESAWGVDRPQTYASLGPRAGQSWQQLISADCQRGVSLVVPAASLPQPNEYII